MWWAKKHTSSCEFVRWKQVFKDEWNEPTVWKYYLAQISHLLYLLLFILGGKPDKKLEDFFVKFTWDGKGKDRSAKDDKADFKTKVAHSKGVWGAVAAAGKSGKRLVNRVKGFVGGGKERKGRKGGPRKNRTPH